MIIFLVFLLVAAIFGLGIFFAVVVVGAQNKAKKNAKRMITAGKIDKTYDKTMKVLSVTKDDLEAADLYHKLSAMKG